MLLLEQFACSYNNKFFMPTNHLISLAEAEEMTKHYRNMNEEILAGPYKNKQILPICETFSREAFDKILLQVGCEKIRIYWGMDETDLVRLVIVGVNAQDQDMLPANDPVIMEAGTRCPLQCPPVSALNS
jgi:hypothetical protein